MDVCGVWAIAQVQAEEDGDTSRTKGHAGKDVETEDREVKVEAEKMSVEGVKVKVEAEKMSVEGVKVKWMEGKMSTKVKEVKIEDLVKDVTRQGDRKKKRMEEPPGLEGVRREVCNVTVGGKRWREIGQGEITIDSAAEESVCPQGWCPEFGTKDPSKWLKFVNASGGSMGHYGERTARFKVKGQDTGIMSLNFQMSDVQKPLVAVRRITERGNTVQFGPRDEDNFIKNGTTGSKIMMTRKGGSYVIPAEMMVEDMDFARRGRD